MPEYIEIKRGVLNKRGNAGFRAFVDRTVVLRKYGSEVTLCYFKANDDPSKVDPIGLFPINRRSFVAVCGGNFKDKKNVFALLNTIDDTPQKDVRNLESTEFEKLINNTPRPVFVFSALSESEKNSWISTLVSHCNEALLGAFEPQNEAFESVCESILNAATPIPTGETSPAHNADPVVATQDGVLNATLTVVTYEKGQGKKASKGGLRNLSLKAGVNFDGKTVDVLKIETSKTISSVQVGTETVIHISSTFEDGVMTLFIFNDANLTKDTASINDASVIAALQNIDPSKKIVLQDENSATINEWASSISASAKASPAPNAVTTPIANVKIPDNVKVLFKGVLLKQGQSGLRRWQNRAVCVIEDSERAAEVTVDEETGDVLEVGKGSTEVGTAIHQNNGIRQPRTSAMSKHTAVVNAIPNVKVCYWELPTGVPNVTGSLSQTSLSTFINSRPRGELELSSTSGIWISPADSPSPFTIMIFECPNTTAAEGASALNFDSARALYDAAPYNARFIFKADSHDTAQDIFAAILDASKRIRSVFVSNENKGRLSIAASSLNIHNFAPPTDKHASPSLSRVESDDSKPNSPSLEKENAPEIFTASGVFKALPVIAEEYAGYRHPKKVVGAVLHAVLTKTTGANGEEVLSANVPHEYSTANWTYRTEVNGFDLIVLEIPAYTPLPTGIEALDFPPSDAHDGFVLYPDYPGISAAYMEQFRESYPTKATAQLEQIAYTSIRDAVCSFGASMTLTRNLFTPPEAPPPHVLPRLPVPEPIPMIFVQNGENGSYSIAERASKEHFTHPNQQQQPGVHRSSNGSENRVFKTESIAVKSVIQNDDTKSDTPKGCCGCGNNEKSDKRASGTTPNRTVFVGGKHQASVIEGKQGSVTGSRTSKSLFNSKDEEHAAIAQRKKQENETQKKGLCC